MASENKSENSTRIFLSSPHMSDEGYEQEYINLAFEQNYISPAGENIVEFEKELADYTGASCAAALSSGTAAIHLALKALGVSAGDIVFCQSLTFAATANPILYENAVPVFIDSDEKTWNLSPDALRRAFEKYAAMGKLPKAVIVVHLYGMAADMDEILKICEEYDTPLLEDAAESLGTTYKGKHTGTFGTAGVFSFNGNKIITTSGGGMLVWNKAFAGKSPEEHINKIRFWATQSRDPARHYQHSEIGYNYRMSNVCAGIGRGQLKILPERVRRKQEIYQYYSNAFQDIEKIKMSPLKEWETCNCWLSAMTLNGNDLPLDVMIALENENIEARPIWKPMHMQPVFADCDYIDNGGVAEKIFSAGVCLPSDTKMTESDLARVVSIVRGVIES